jgi:membrane protease YdiL (CAAX protease family)
MDDTVKADPSGRTQDEPPGGAAPFLVRLVSAVAFVLLVILALVLPTPSTLYLKSAFGLVLLAGCLVFLAGGSQLLAPGVFLLLAYLTRCLPVYTLFLMLAAPLALYGLLVWKVPALHHGRRGFVTGSIEKSPLIIAIVLTALSVTSLIIWYVVGDVDFSGFTNAFSDRATALIILGGLLFSAVNIVVTEAVFRGVVWQGLEEYIPKALPVVLIQGLLYGASHYWGAIPNGWEGAILAGVFGLFLGIVRHASRGILLPILSHLCADLTLLALVLHSLGRF